MNARLSVLSAALALAVAGSAYAQSTGTAPPAAPTPGVNKPTLPPGTPAPQPGKPVIIPSGHMPSQGPADVSKCALKFEAMRHDWGEITDTSPVQFTFKFTNTSDKTITISSVRATCGCTTPQLNKKTYAPHEDGEIPVTFNPANRKGPQTKNVIVESDDPECNRLELTLTSNVMPLVFIEPSKIFFNESMRGQGATQTVTVTGREANFEISSIEGDSPVFKVNKVKSEPIQEDGRTMTRVTLELNLAKDAPVGTHNYTFILNTTDPKAAKVNMPVAGTVVGEVRATPPGMLVRTFTPSTPFQGQVQIDSRSGKPFNIKSVDVEGQADMNLAVDFQPSTQDGKPVYLVTLSGSTPAAAGQYRGIITVETDIPNEEPFKFNWIATVRDVGSASTPAPGAPGRPALAPNKALTPASTNPAPGAGTAKPGVGTAPPAKPSTGTAPGNGANAPK
jgi:hypothetical protein